MLFFRKYWIELLVFGIIFGVLLLCNLPGMTWINTDSDGPHYILSAKYTGVAHNTSAPLYLILGKGFVNLPIRKFRVDGQHRGVSHTLSQTKDPRRGLLISFPFEWSQSFPGTDGI